ncbi:MAG: ABC transporter permease [Bryobacteraceae bacterium]|nr:ABC transporter permease [Bryobacteraceae bacterium]
MNTKDREIGKFALVEATAQDFHYGLRSLRKSPGFAITAVVVLALAIGASTAMFSVLNTVLLRPLPYQSPERLVMLFAEDPTRNFREGRSALWDVDQWRSQSHSFEGLATFDAMSTFLTGADGVEQIVGASISHNLLPLLGVRPILGRSFSAEEAEQGQRLVLISHRFWQARFGGSHGALGATLVLNGFPSQIIGILPAGFKVARLEADVWESHPRGQTVRGRDGWFAVGRLRSSVTFELAQTEMTAVARRLSDQLPADARNRTISVVPLSRYIVGAQSRLGLWMLGGAVFCVFLIATANVTSLSLARSIARSREMAIRAALGASAGRIVRQLIAEGVLLSVFSGLVGTLLASAGIDLIRAFGPRNLPRLNEIGLDLGGLGWALAISLLAGILVGLSPALATSRRDLRPSGGEGGRSVSGGVGIRRARRALVVADFALAIMLLAGGGLLIRSWWNVNSINPGFRSQRVLVMELSAPMAFSIPAKQSFYHSLLESIKAIPDVEDAGIIGELFKENNREAVVTAERDGDTVSERLQFAGEEVSADFFKAIGTPLLRGRFFSTDDGPDAPPVAIINDAMARRSWPGHDALGKRFKLGPRDSGNPWYIVVGVVADMRVQGPEREPFPQMFVPLAQSGPPRNVDLFVRTSSGYPQAMTATLRAAVRGVEKNASVGEVATLEQQFGAYFAQRRFQTSLLIGFSIVALLMAAVGIYGLIQYSIETRTREIGIRMAIGAQAGGIFRMILGEGMKLTLTGLILGLLGALWLGQASSGLLFGVTATDPLTFVVVSVLLIAVAIAACYVPARRAMKLDPIMALRQE